VALRPCVSSSLRLSMYSAKIRLTAVIPTANTGGVHFFCRAVAAPVDAPASIARTKDALLKAIDQPYSSCRRRSWKRVLTAPVQIGRGRSGTFKSLMEEKLNPDQTERRTLTEKLAGLSMLSISRLRKAVLKAVAIKNIEAKDISS